MIRGFPRGVRRILEVLRGRVDRVERNSMREIAELREEISILKSSLEVPAEWIEEFQSWKVNTPIPAEPMISVCIGTYNRARLLTERAIPSILTQTYPRFELIVVGDGCTDDTEERVRKIGDPRVRFVNLPERGLYPEEPNRRWMVAGTATVNHALRLASGDFITHLDDDDEHLPGRLEALTGFAHEHGADFLWHPFWVENQDGPWQLNEAQDFVYAQVTTSSVFYRSWLKRIEWNVNAHLLMEPGDWNRFRRIKYLTPIAVRYPEPLLKHYRERAQNG